MAIREVTVEGATHQNINFKDHSLAHALLNERTGIECGASSHNSFHLPGSINVAPNEQVEYYRDSQIVVNGKYAEIDVFDDAETLTNFENDSQGYIIHSHMFEHLPNPIKALLTWNRVVKDGGYVFMIVPQRDAHPADVGRELTTWEEWINAYIYSYTPETIPAERTEAAGGHRGHYYCYCCESLKALITQAIQYLGLNWELIAEEDPDKKVSNGFTLVYMVHKPKLVSEPPPVSPPPE